MLISMVLHCGYNRVLVYSESLIPTGMYRMWRDAPKRERERAPCTDWFGLPALSVVGRGVVLLERGSPGGQRGRPRAVSAHGRVRCRRAVRGGHSDLRHTFSEFGLIRKRVLVEVRWLQALSALPGVREVPTLSEEASRALDGLAVDFSHEDALRVKEIEKSTNHDVKAVEYFLKERVADHAEPAVRVFHFSCT